MRSNTHLNTFSIESSNQEKLSVEINMGLFVIYFLLFFRCQTTHIALRHTSEQQAQRQVVWRKCVISLCTFGSSFLPECLASRWLDLFLTWYE